MLTRLLLAATLLTAAGVAQGAAVVAERVIDDNAVVGEVTVHDGRLAGVVINRSDRPLARVEVLVRYDWIWADARNPGHDSPGWSEFVTIDRVIGPGDAVPFEYVPGRPLPARDDGHFLPSVEVVAVTPYE